MKSKQLRLFSFKKAVHRGNVCGAVLVLLLIFFISCSKKVEADSQKVPVATDTKVGSVKTAPWLVFDQRPTGALRLIPLQDLSKAQDSLPAKNWLPWTQALRVSGIGLMYRQARVLLNQVGVFSIADLQKNAQLKQSFEANTEFRGRSATGLYQTDSGTMVKLNVNVILAEANIQKKDAHEASNEQAFLYRYNPIAEKCEPFLNTADIALSPRAQCTALERTDTKWLASFKDQDGDSVSFIYLSFDSMKELAEKKYRFIDRGDFQTQLEPGTYFGDAFFSKAFKQSFPVYAEIFHKNNAFRKQYKLNSSSETEQICYGFYRAPNEASPIEAAVLYPDGTLYIQENGMMRTIVLPVLPKNFVYTYCIPYHDFVALAWEEQSFFYVRNAGLYIPPNSSSSMPEEQ